VGTAEANARIASSRFMGSALLKYVRRSAVSRLSCTARSCRLLDSSTEACERESASLEAIWVRWTEQLTQIPTNAITTLERIPERI
jgi:hypothetical protein